MHPVKNRCTLMGVCSTCRSIYQILWEWQILDESIYNDERESGSLTFTTWHRYGGGFGITYPSIDRWKTSFIKRAECMKAAPSLEIAFVDTDWGMKRAWVMKKMDSETSVVLSSIKMDVTVSRYLPWTCVISTSRVFQTLFLIENLV